MTAQTPTVLKTYFETGDKPTQAQFANLIDSYVNTVQTSAQQILSDVSALGNFNLTGQLNAASSIVVGAPTGGSKGIGTVNATGIYVNGTLITTTSAGGSGTVMAATSGQLAYYTANSNTVGGISVLPDAITVTTRSQNNGTGSPASCLYVDTAVSAVGVRSPSSQAATGTSIDFTGIPSTAKLIFVEFESVGTNGSSIPIIQIGAGSVSTSGYLGSGATVITGASPVIANSTQGFLTAGDSFSTYVRHGVFTLTKRGGNVWSMSGLHGFSDSPRMAWSGGSMTTLAGALDRVRITTVNGTDAFNNGNINITYQ